MPLLRGQRTIGCGVLPSSLISIRGAVEGVPQSNLPVPDPGDNKFNSRPVAPTIFV